MKKAKIESLKDVTEEMATVFEELRNEKLSAGKAKELSNAAGKIISSIKTQIEYNKLTKNNQKIKFAESHN